MSGNRYALLDFTEKKAAKSAAVSPISYGTFLRSIFYSTLLGAIFGGLALGLVGYLIATGRFPVAGLETLAASGAAPAIFVAAGIGIALGGLLGAFRVLLRFAPPNPPGK